MKPYREIKYNPPTFFYLFLDGSLIHVIGEGSSLISDGDFWLSPGEYLKKFLSLRMGRPGHYFIRDSTITLQVFEINPGAVFQENTLELRGLIKNDSTIKLTRGICNWCTNSWLRYNKGGQVDFDNLEYKFYKTNVRSDSSIWFKEKKWYKKKVWNRNENKKATN